MRTFTVNANDPVMKMGVDLQAVMFIRYYVDENQNNQVDMVVQGYPTVVNINFASHADAAQALYDEWLKRFQTEDQVVQALPKVKRQDVLYDDPNAVQKAQQLNDDYLKNLQVQNGTGQINAKPADDVPEETRL